MQAKYELYNRVVVVCEEKEKVALADPDAMILKFIGCFGYVVQVVPPDKFDEFHTYKVRLDIVDIPLTFWEEELLCTN